MYRSIDNIIGTSISFPVACNMPHCNFKSGINLHKVRAVGLFAKNIGGKAENRRLHIDYIRESKLENLIPHYLNKIYYSRFYQNCKLKLIIKIRIYF